MSFIFFKDIFFNLIGWEISIILLLGFSVIILVFFIFINLNHHKGNKTLFQIRFLSENSIKFLILIFFMINIFISTNLGSKSIILWKNLNFLNYFKAIITIIVCAYLPGASLFKIFFPDDILSEKFGIEPMILKLTFYPLLSFGFLGISVLFFDQLGFNIVQIEINLVITILALFFVDIIFQVKRSNAINLKLINVNISRYSFIILLLAFGISIISIGFSFGLEYLISGDPWDAIKFANQIGDPNKSPLFLESYPNFWGYISFGLSVLSSAPIININTLLAPFSYLFITSIYLFMKSILFNFKIKYAVFSTVLMSIFSGIFIYPLVSSLIFVSEYYFIYKSYSYFLFFNSLALFIAATNNKSYKSLKIGKFFKTTEFKMIFFASFFLILSLMTYMFPLLISIIFLLIYCLFSDSNRKFLNFNYLILLTLMIAGFLLVFDVFLNFYLSYNIIEWLNLFFTRSNEFTKISIFIRPLLIYPVFLLFIFIIYILNKVFFKEIAEKNEKSKMKFNKSKLYKIVLVTLTIFFLIELFFGIFELIFLDVNLSDNFFFFLILDKFFLNIGLIGISGIYLSYYCFKKNKNLYFNLLFWILISYIFALLIIFLEMIINFPLSPESIPESNNQYMIHWFNRIWFYSIPPLCIFACIGIFEFIKKIRKIEFFQRRNKSFKILIKNLSLISILYLSFSGIIITGVIYGNKNFRYSNNQIKTLEWVSENIPIHKGVVVGDNFFMGVGVDSITFVRQYFFYDIFEEDFNETQCIEQIEYLKNETIQYAVISQFFISYYLNKSDFTNNILIPQFYNITLYQEGGLSVHYAPYFD